MEVALEGVLGVSEEDVLSRGQEVKRYLCDSPFTCQNSSWLPNPPSRKTFPSTPPQNQPHTPLETFPPTSTPLSHNLIHNFPSTLRTKHPKRRSLPLRTPLNPRSATDVLYTSEVVIANAGFEGIERSDG